MVGSNFYFSNLGVLLPLSPWVVGCLFLVCHQQAAIFQAGQGSERLGGGGATPASTQQLAAGPQKLCTFPRGRLFTACSATGSGFVFLPEFQGQFQISVVLCDPVSFKVRAGT